MSGPTFFAQSSTILIAVQQMYNRAKQMVAQVQRANALLRKALYRGAATALIAILLASTSVAEDRSGAHAESSCDEYVLLSSHPLSELPRIIQEKLRQAVRPKLQAIILDPGMGMRDTVLQDIPLNGVEVSRTSQHDALYVVAWDDASFGVNGFNWIVEIERGEANSLLVQPAGSFSGFGVKVLESAKERYPELMVASKGFADGGGAIAVAGCFQKAGRYYVNTSCPASCEGELNRQ